MRAAVMTGPGRVEVATVPDPTPQPGEVVVEVAAAGLCGTDLHLLSGELAPLPVVPGHELSGTVVAVAADVGARSGPVGRRVAVDPNISCHSCRPCRTGRPNLCADLQAVGITRPGGAAQFVAVPAVNCVTVPDSVDLADAALIEPLSCAVRGYDILRSRLGSSVLVIGAGTMGLMMMQLAGRCGAATVDVVDVNPDRLDRARALGCTAAAAGIEQLDRPGGWDVVIEATGAPVAIQAALDGVATGGTLLQFGVASPDTEVRLRPYDIYRREITIAGSMAVLNSFERAADLLAAGFIDQSVLITDRRPLAEYPDALDGFRRGTGLKTQVLPGLA